MMSGSRKNRPSGLFTCLLLLSAAAFAAGCTTSNTSGGGGQPVNHLEPSGNSVPGWVVPTGGSLHAGAATNEYISGESPSSCSSCHGSDLSGGISKVSCFGNAAGCHHGTIAGWVATPPATQNHGVSAKAAPGDGSFFSCQICHGADFRTIRGGTNCFSCHTRAPHAPRPWRTGAGSLYDHGTTNTANAPVCYTCHAYAVPQNPNNPHQPTVPAPAGTSPGCYNGTMCHNQAGHPAGWTAVPPAAQPHGDTAKKDGTVPGQGFPSCQTCHGDNFAGGSANVPCFTCHGVSAPHAPKPWRGSPYTHTTTVEAGNAPVCYTCHAYTGTANPRNPHPPPSPAPPGTAPGCFNGTMCHNQAGHPAGWVATSPAAQPHGDSAKATPGATAGYAYCQTCHGTGTNFSGGTSGVSCYPCHVPTSISPHASQWRTGDTYVHTTTATGNAPVCAYCHLNGAISPIAPPSPPAPAGTAPGCFNSTLCHGTGGIAHPVPYNDNSHYTVTSATFPGSCSACHDVSAPSTKVGPVCQTCHVAASPLTALNCTSCHASPPNGGAPAGSAYPNIAGAHAAHIALTSAGTPISCNTCHNGLGGLPSTLNHYNNAKTRVPPGNVAFLATYYAKTGQSSFDNSAALNCSNVSCHGGQATPNWQNGTLNVNTQCTNCHQFGPSVGNPQYNSPYSGEHDRNTPSFPNAHRTCTNCHNTTALAVNHFTTLADNTMSPAVASATIGGTGTLISSWTPGAGTSGSCTPFCHGTETW